MDKKMSFERKPAPAPDDEIFVRHIGAESGNLPFYLYADVLDELVYHASQRAGFGLLSGCGYLYPLDKRLTTSESKMPEPDIPDYIEVTAFRDIYPVVDALDYAGYLRRVREFRNVRGDVVGLVCLVPEPRSLMYEDLMLMRTYFGAETNLFLIVCGKDASVLALRLERDSWVLKPCGIELVGCVENDKVSQPVSQDNDVDNQTASSVIDESKSENSVEVTDK